MCSTLHSTLHVVPSVCSNENKFHHEKFTLHARMRHFHYHLPALSRELEAAVARRTDALERIEITEAARDALQTEVRELESKVERVEERSSVTSEELARLIATHEEATAKAQRLSDEKEVAEAELQVSYENFNFLILRSSCPPAYSKLAAWQ